MQAGILLAFAAYFAFACGDATAKAIGARLPVFEIGFFISLIALAPVAFTKRPGDTWSNVFVPKHPLLLTLRMASGTLGGILGIYAFTTLPLAEAYALIFLLPLFVTVFSWLVLKEPIGWRRWLAVFGGLAGVLLVVRPGFREVLPGHFAAVGVAICGAITVIVLRVLGPAERRITLIGAVLVAAIAVNGVLMVPDFVPPTADLWPLLLFGGVVVGLAHLLIVFATRLAPAARVAPTQYSQIVWAALIGASFFGEYPDGIAVAGMVLVGMSGLFTFVRETEKTPWPQKTPLIRNR
ncbi:DMT family transporter [Aurantimonas sp. VKM B-3413]|uniref:DMT family transporter n=1 Tax=Aurantimonas sp. VKM B-3413 TaxID=2779401 RepID=UPI001E34C703|nr:DMT family transporter [Aurantimonas sp. VKM B-3413]MCB8840718.1 DMT family transporter [Aurantimonas sp. VKM B-3413]